MLPPVQNPDGTIDLSFRNNAGFELEIDLTDANNNPIDVTGWHVGMACTDQGRKGFQVDDSSGDIIVGNTNGIIQVVLPNSLYANQAPSLIGGFITTLYDIVYVTPAEPNLVLP